MRSLCGESVGKVEATSTCADIVRLKLQVNVVIGHDNVKWHDLATKRPKNGGLVIPPDAQFQDIAIAARILVQVKMVEL